MDPSNAERKTPPVNTISLLGKAYSLLGFQIVDGVVGAGYPQKPKHSAVFAQLGPEGARLSDLARNAGMSPQAMGELVDELETLGYVRREPDPTDRRAKVIRLTDLGAETVSAAGVAIAGIEQRLDEILGAEQHKSLRAMLEDILRRAAP